MTDLAHEFRRFLVGGALAVLASTPAFAATYAIGLLEGGTGTGSGSFTFTNPGTVGSTPVAVSLSTNPSSTIGAQTFGSVTPPIGTPPGTLNVQVAAVNFSDGKTPPNQITGNFVEGLTGSLATTPVTGLRPSGPCSSQLCFYRITFSFTSNPNPNSALKSYTIQLILQGNNPVLDTPVSSAVGRYSVRNTTSTVPEPGSLALALIGLGALGWAAAARPRRQRVAATR